MAIPSKKKTPPRRPKSGHCMQMLGVFSDYLDREAKARLCRRIEEHLKECPECRLYVDTMKKTVVLYRNLGDEKVPAGVSQRLFKTIRLEEMKKGGGRGVIKLSSSLNKTK